MEAKQITLQIKTWLKNKGYENKIIVRSIRGTWHFDNCDNYWLTGKQIAEQATGIEFVSYGVSMARPKN